MTAQVLNSFLMIFVLLAFNACSGKQVEIQYVDRVTEKKVPVKCILEEPKCNHLEETDTALITEARLCIKRYKEVFKLCNKQSKEAEK